MFDVERPFNRLIHHFVYRAFHGAGSDGGELQFAIPILLGLLSTPSAFGSIMLLGKYFTLHMLLMGKGPIDVYRVSIPDEYFFIVYSMAITGAIVILKWDRLFPDRQDYDNLAPLPLSQRQIFLASLAALLFLAALFALDINIAACVIFPIAVTSQYSNSTAILFRFTFAHASALLLSSFFACFSLLAALGMTMILVPGRYRRTASLLVRIAAALFVVTLVGSAFGVTPMLTADRPPSFVAYIPSVWFLDVYERLLGRGVSIAGTAGRGVILTLAAFVITLASYAWSYYRDFARIPEQTSLLVPRGRDKPHIFERLFDRLVLRTPVQRAAYHFTLRTLFRSEQHCLLFGGALSIGFFLAAQSISDALSSPVQHGVDPRLLAVPLILAYTITVSLRVLFDLPADGNANWIFRALVDSYHHEARTVATKVTLSLIVPWLFLVALPVCAAAWGWKTAVLHILYVLMASTTLTEVLLLRFRKIPFTCKRTVSKDRILVNVLFCMVGISIFVTTGSSLDRALIAAPMRFLLIVPWFIAILWAVRAIEREAHRSDRILLFEERPEDRVRLIELGL